MRLAIGELERLLGDRLSWRERMGAPAWLTPELVASTPTATEHLANWLEADGLNRPMPDLHREVSFHGDVELLAPLCDALAVVAPPARDFVLSVAAFVGTGWSTRGWTGRIPSWPRVVVLSGASRDAAAIQDTVLHEAAHVWLEALPEPVTISAAGEQGLFALAEREGWRDAGTAGGVSVRGHIETTERRANG